MEECYFQGAYVSMVSTDHTNEQQTVCWDGIIGAIVGTWSQKARQGNPLNVSIHSYPILTHASVSQPRDAQVRTACSGNGQRMKAMKTRNCTQMTAPGRGISPIGSTKRTGATRRPLPLLASRDLSKGYCTSFVRIYPFVPDMLHVGLLLIALIE